LSAETSYACCKRKRDAAHFFPPDVGSSRPYMCGRAGRAAFRNDEKSIAAMRVAAS